AGDSPEIWSRSRVAQNTRSAGRIAPRFRGLTRTRSRRLGRILRRSAAPTIARGLPAFEIDRPARAPQANAATGTRRTNDVQNDRRASGVCEPCHDARDGGERADLQPHSGLPRLQAADNAPA